MHGNPSPLASSGRGIAALSSRRGGSRRGTVPGDDSVSASPSAWSSAKLHVPRAARVASRGASIPRSLWAAPAFIPGAPPLDCRSRPGRRARRQDGHGFLVRRVLRQRRSNLACLQRGNAQIRLCRDIIAALRIDKKSLQFKRHGFESAAIEDFSRASISGPYNNA